MSSDSSPPPPGRPRLPSIVSDDGDIVDAQYPPMNQPSTSQEPLIRQAVGFSWNIPSSSVNSYSASPPGTAPPQFLPGQSVEPLPQSQTRETERRKKSSKPREPGTSRSKSHKDKSRHQGYDAPTGSRAFRVEGYVNEPSHPGPPRSPPSGPYRSDYRAEGSPPLVRSRGKSRPQREESSVPPNVPSSQRSQSQRQPRHHNDYEGDPISSQPPRERDYVSQESHSFYAGSHSSATFTDSQSPARSHRVHKNRSSRRPEPEPTSSQPTPRTSDRYSRPLRIVTLLIEDRRPGQAIDQLAEVRVPLREMQYPEDGFWADAKEICDELQASPSRIDGPAKVFATRGKYKQCFLRVTANGVDECAPANLKVNADRTLEIEVIENPSVPLHSRGSFSRDILTPITDAVPTPVIAPQPMVPFNVDRFSPGRYDNEPSPTVPRKRRHSVSSRSSISESFRSQRNHVLDNRSHQPSPHPPNFSISQRSMGSQDDSLESQNISTGSQNTSSHSAKSHHSSVSRDSAGTRPSPMSQPSPPSHRSPTSYVSPPPEQHPSSEPLFSPLSPSPVDIPSPVEPNPPLVSSTFLPGPSIPKKPRHVAPTFVHDQEGQSHRATATPSLIASASGFGSFNQGSSGFGFGAYATQSQSLGNVSSQHSFLSSQPPPAPIEKNPEQEALDNKVGLYLRSIFTADPGWNEFVEARKQVLPVSGLLNQYRYVREKFLAYVGKHTPSELEGAPHVRITRTQVMRAFNLPVTWGEDGVETLELTSMYGPKGKRCEDPRVVAMMDEMPPISTKMQGQKYLTLLREIHSRWTIEHPGS